MRQPILPQGLILAACTLVFALVEIPVFDGGALRAQIDAAEERVVQAALSYRQTLLFAMEDVEAALLSYDGARARRDALSGAVASNRQAFERSSALYRQGFATFLDVLDSQRTLNAALQELAISERDIALALIDLFSALGLAQKPDDQAPRQASPNRASFRRRASSSLR